MKHLLPYIFSTICILSNTFSYAKETNNTNEIKAKKSVKEYSKEDMKLLSQAYGHHLTQNMNAIDLNLDTSEIISGIQDALNGVESPLDLSRMGEMINALQLQKFENECSVNLKAAEAFLASNLEDSNIVQLQEGKVQYKQITKGTGEVCKESDTVLVRYIGKYLNGETFAEASQDQALTLSDTIEGFQKATVGMKVGEKREIYIHPNLGYGVNSCMTPNALLTFEIELRGMQKDAAKETMVDEVTDFPFEDTFATTSETSIK